MICESEPCIFVRGPSWDVTTGPLRRLRTGPGVNTWAEPGVYGKWLLAAAKADDVWQRLKEEPRYRKQLERIPSGYFPAFGPTAIWLVSLLPNKPFLRHCHLKRQGRGVTALVSDGASFRLLCLRQQTLRNAGAPLREHGRCKKRRAGWLPNERAGLLPSATVFEPDDAVR